MKLTPIYQIPYLDGSEKAFQIIDASRDQALAVESALSEHGVNPPNLDAARLASRLTALESTATSTRQLPLVHAKRVTEPRSNNGQWEPLTWQAFTNTGTGIAYANNSANITVQKRGIYLLIFSAEVRGETLAIQITDASGANITSGEQQASGSVYARVQLLFVVQANPGDVLQTRYRCSGTSASLTTINTFFSVIGLRDLSA